MVVPFMLLAVAIAIEVASTAALPRTDGFRDPLWATIAVVGVVFLGEPWNAVKIFAIALIVMGVVMLNLQAAP